MTTRRWMSPLLILLMLAFVMSASAWADSNIRIVRLSLVDGPVQLDRGTGEGFDRAIMNMPIGQGMQLWTRGDSRAEVEFEDGATLRVAPGAKIEFPELVLKSDGTRRTVVRVDSGRVYVDYPRSKEEDFHILFGDRDIALDRSIHFRIDVSNDRAQLAVLKGDLELPNRRVKKENTVTFALVGNESYEVAKGVDAVLEDSWDAYRTDYHDSYAKSAYKGSSFYGNSGLNYYGSWFTSPYGNCWRPYGFDASWDPYSSGAWVYYPGYGYSFVSLYPWGWQPYRSGSWNYLGTGFGYCWSPNRTYYGYGWAPVRYAPSAYVAPQPPGKSPVSRIPGTAGMLPVGGVNTTGNWKPTTPIILDRSGRTGRDGAVSAVGGVAPPVAAAAGVNNSTRTVRGVHAIGPQPGIVDSRPPSRNDGPASMGSRVSRQDRGFSGEGGGGAMRSSAPAMREPARMSAPAPAPAPVHSAPSGGGGGSRPANPK